MTNNNKNRFSIVYQDHSFVLSCHSGFGLKSDGVIDIEYRIYGYSSTVFECDSLLKLPLYQDGAREKLKSVLLIKDREFDMNYTDIDLVMKIFDRQDNVRNLLINTLRKKSSFYSSYYKKYMTSE